MDWGVSKLRWVYVAGYESCIYFVFLLPSPMNTIGLNSTEKPSALTPRDPLPALTTAFSLTSISERENNSSETTPPLNPDSTPTEGFRSPLDNPTTLNVAGWHREVNWNEFRRTCLSFWILKFSKQFFFKLCVQFLCMWFYLGVLSVGHLGVHEILIDHRNKCSLLRRRWKGMAQVTLSGRRGVSRASSELQALHPRPCSCSLRFSAAPDRSELSASGLCQSRPPWL